MNKFGRGQLCDYTCTYLEANIHFSFEFIPKIKAVGLVVSDKKIYHVSLYEPMLNMGSPWRGHFWPQEQNLNKLGRGPPNINGFREEDSKVFISEIYFSLCDLGMQRTETIYIIIEEGHIRNIPAKFGQIQPVV